MGIKHFIRNEKSTLGLKDFKRENKKKSLNSLLKSLKSRKRTITNALELSLKKKEIKEFKEEIDILSLHIRKGEKLLYDLNNEK